MPSAIEAKQKEGWFTLPSTQVWKKVTVEYSARKCMHGGQLVVILLYSSIVVETPHQHRISKWFVVT